jgi:hypothetical protein
MNEEEMEKWKAENAAQLAQYNAENALNRELFKAVILAGQGALKSSILINGGAAVALLAFIGGTLDGLCEIGVILWFLLSLVLFVTGVVLTAIASGVAYLAQRAYHLKDDEDESGDRINKITITLVVLSYVCFTTGCLTSIVSFAITM